MNHTFHYWQPVRVHYADHASLHMKDLIIGKRVLILISTTLYHNGTAKAIEASLAGKNVTFFTGIQPDPSTQCVDKATEAAREVDADTIIGIGGGSCMDVAKAVACLKDTPDSILAYLGTQGKAFTERKTQLILVPTTAGTGSEVTNIGVFTNITSGEKLPLASDPFYADDAIIDPLLSYTTPPKVTANTGMDAFAHALEAYWNANSNPISDALAISAMKKIMEYLHQAYEHPQDAQARNHMMVASLLAGMAFSQTRTTGCHVLSYPLSTMYHGAHGESCAISLSAFIRISHEKEAEKMILLERELGYADQNEFADAVEALLQSVHMPTRLSQLGVKKSDVDTIIQTAMKSKKQLDLSPALMDENRLRRLIDSIL